MAPEAPPPAEAATTIWSGGPCPSCPGTGALTILRRENDGRLLFHCPGCGLAFTHAPAGAEPEYGKSLAEVARGGTRPATREEIDAAGLGGHAQVWRVTPPPAPLPRKDPAASFAPPSPLARRPSVPLHSARTGGSTVKAGKALGGLGALFLILKILFAIFGHGNHR